MVDNRYVRLAPRMCAMIVFFCLPLTGLNPKRYLAVMSTSMYLVMLVESLLGLEKGGRLVEPSKAQCERVRD